MSARPNRWQKVWTGGSLGGLLAVLLTVGCHNAPRNNPLDPELTPGVELLSATTDSLAGTATLTWSQYAGDQPFCRCPAGHA